MEVTKYLCEFFFYELLALAWVDHHALRFPFRYGHHRQEPSGDY